MNTHPAAVLHGPDSPPADRTVRERLESMNFARGFLLGAALSTPVWAIFASVLGALTVVTR